MGKTVLHARAVASCAALWLSACGVEVDTAGDAEPTPRVSLAVQQLTAADCPAGYNVIQGTNATETLTGTAGSDCIVGKGGNDTIFGRGGNDFLIGGDGNDTLYGEAGDDTLYGESGGDRLEGGDGNDLLYGGLNVDNLFGQNGDDQLYGEAAGDTLEGGLGKDTLRGGDGDDVLRGGDDDDRLLGEAGIDNLYGDAGRDVLHGGTQADTIWGGDGDDVIQGFDGNDTLNGEAGDDAVIGGLGTNTINGGVGIDACSGSNCEKPALTPAGCMADAQCSGGQRCIVDVGLCLLCVSDQDGDGVCDSQDGCATDANKSAPGVCGCGVADTDSDADGTANCNDGCPNDASKVAAGVCGCGIADTDGDGDGTANCNDACPNDASKVAAGVCGCGVADTDSDGDGVPNCNDGCPNDASKVAAGVCGCGVADTDSDGDGVPNCNDVCPSDAFKLAPGLCGCGVADADSDGDGAPNCIDGCPSDALKVAAGICGCGIADTDSDADGTANCNDGCPTDAAKVAAGVCGCGIADTDSDGDGTANCNDGCPNDAAKTSSGVCGCGIADTDSDGDGTANCNDACPDDAAKTSSGVCGCGIADTDSDLDGAADCVDVCPGSDDSLDMDSNGVPDGCQECLVNADCTPTECSSALCNALGECTLTPLPAPTEWINGDFETHDLTGFTTYTTGNGTATVTTEAFATAAPSVTSWSTRLVVGERVSVPTGTEGGGISQTLVLHNGSLTVTANIAAFAPSSTNGDGGLLRLYVDGSLLDEHNFGTVSAGVTYRETLSGTLASVSQGSHTVKVEARRGFISGAVRNYVDNIVLSGTAFSAGTACGGAFGTCDGAGNCELCSNTDGDGVCDEDDVCPGFDDAIDPDGDGIPTGCDACPTDNPNDSDGDTVCESADECPGFDDRVDVDHNGIPDDCQECVTAADCVDGNPCTLDTCSATFCSFPIATGASCAAGGTCSATGQCENQTCQFVPLGDLPGGQFNSMAFAVSDDGLIVTGRSHYTSSTAGYKAFRWQASTGMVGLSSITSSGRGISADGSRIVGIAGSEITYSSQQAFREQPTFIQTASLSSTAHAVSADGTITVGDTNNQAFRWVQGSSSLQLLNVGTTSTARSISADGTKIVGRGSIPGHTGGEAYIWTATSLTGLGDFAGSFAYNSEAWGISPNGNIVVGKAAGPNSTMHGFKWTQQTGLVSLGNGMHPYAVSNTGTIVGTWSSTAYVFDSFRGTGNLQTLLQNCGLNMSGWSLTELRDITPDGHTIVGVGTNPSGNFEAVLVRLY